MVEFFMKLWVILQFGFGTGVAVAAFIAGAAVPYIILASLWQAMKSYLNLKEEQ